MDQIFQNEATPGLREATVLIMKSGVGVTGVTLSGLTPAALKICKSGGSFVTSSNGATLTELSGAVDVGLYVIQFGAADVDTVGDLRYELTLPGTIDTCRGTVSVVRPLVVASDTRLNNLDAPVSAIPTSPLLASDSRLNNLDAQVSTRSTQTSVNALPSASAIVTALLTAVLGNDGVRNRTVQGVLRRLDWLMTSKATGLLSTLAQYFMYDGTTVGIGTSQDTTAGSRTASATVTGD